MAGDERGQACRIPENGVSGEALMSPLHQQTEAAEAKRLQGTLDAPPDSSKRLDCYTRADAMSVIKSLRSREQTAGQHTAAQIAQVCQTRSPAPSFL